MIHNTIVIGGGSAATFTVTFKSSVDESVLSTIHCGMGSNITYDGVPPTKPQDAQYTYSFSGWSRTKGGNAVEGVLNNVQQDMTLWSAFTGTLRSYTVTFMNGTSVWDTQTVLYGSTATPKQGTPTKSSTVSTDYTFVGWASSDNQKTADANILKNITGPKTVYAAYSEAVRKYTVTWKNIDGSTLKTEQVAYGTTPKYSGSNPTYLSWTFTGWNPTPGPVTGPTTYIATYSYPAGMSETISKDWDQIIADAKAGTTSGYKELDTKIMVTTDNKVLCYEIGGIKKDSGSTFTFITRTIDGKCQWNTSDTNSGGYPSSNYKKYIEGTCLSHIPSNIKNAMKSVTKTYRMGSGDSGATKSASYTIWPPSILEMNWTDTSSYNETSGVKYTAYTSNSQRIRYDSSGSASSAWLRSAANGNTDNARYIYSNGVWNYSNCSYSYGALPCFCL